MNDMDRNKGIEEALKHALRREEAPEGFAERVLARVSERHTGPRQVRDSWLSFFTRPIFTQPIFTQPIVRWAALAAVAIAMIVGVQIYNVRRERAQGEAAKERLMLALRITGSKLQLARARVNDVNANQNKNRQVKE
jgi:hypothetical protein